MGSMQAAHRSVHYPFVCPAGHMLREGKNEIAVRVTTGLEEVTDEQLSQINWAVCRKMTMEENTEVITAGLLCADLSTQ